MGRLRLIVHSPRWLVLTALALLSLAVGATLMSGAGFSSHSGNSAALSAGSLKLTSSKPDQAIVGASGMVPGESRAGTIEIANSGDVAGNVTLKLVGLVDTPAGSPLSSVLELEVADITGGGSSRVWSGKLGSLGSVLVGTFAASQTRIYRFTLSWPAGSTDAALQGTSTTFSFEWVGVS